MRQSDFISVIKGKIETEKRDGKDATDEQVSARLGISLPSVKTWGKSQKPATPSQIANILLKAQAKAARDAQSSAIEPIVEFLRLDQVHLKEGGVREIFSRKTSHTYLRGLRDGLVSHCGIYLFHDSSGHALYVGRTRKQTLWTEINLAFNRERPSQVLKRVSHPARNVTFKTAEDITRPIAVTAVALFELALYLSVYRVAPHLIADLEALLIRSFANDVRNVKMENFGW